MRGTTPRADEALNAVMQWWRLFATSLLFTLLIVLVFFMGVLPIHPDIPAFVDVPIARSASKSPEFEHDLTVSIRSDGRTYLANDELDVDTIERRISTALRSGEHQPALRIRADAAARFQTVRVVVRAARNAGFRRVTFMVRQELMTMEMGFAFAAPAETPNPWPAAGIAVLCVAGAVMIRFARRSESSRPGCAGWILLLAAALALLVIWSAYFPSCPPGLWC